MLSKLVQLKRITKRGVEAKPSVAGQFVFFFWQKIAILAPFSDYILIIFRAI